MKRLPQEAPISILYIEDEQSSRESIGRMLSAAYPAYSLHCADNGAAGLALFQEQWPDIVLTDINMPVMNGIDMAREISRLRPDTNIIFLTAFSDQEYLFEAIKIGICRYVLKPLEIELLFEAIDDCAARIVLERQVRKTKRKFYTIFQAAPAMIIIATLADGRCMDVNETFVECTGIPYEDIVGRCMENVGIWTTPHERVLLGEELLEKGSIRDREVRMRDRSGNTLTGLLSAEVVEIEDEPCMLCLVKDITERKKMGEQIELLNTMLSARAFELETANKELDAFNYTVSHDLRGPLTSIHGFCQLLLDQCGDNLDQQSTEFVNEIFSQAKRMEHLISTLIDFSRLNQYPLNGETVELGLMAQAIAMEHRMREPERRISLDIDEGITAHGDSRLLRVALGNLIGNAWKYTAKREAAAIEFGMQHHKGETVYYVRDNGAGFDDSYRENLFLPFKRLHHANEFPGTGIGLATVHRIVTRHGGRIWAEGAVDQGAVFYFTLTSSDRGEVPRDHVIS